MPLMHIVLFKLDEAKATGEVTDKAKITPKATNANNKAYGIEQKGLVVASGARAGFPGPRGPKSRGARAPDASTNPFCLIP